MVKTGLRGKILWGAFFLTLPLVWALVALFSYGSAQIRAASLEARGVEVTGPLFDALLTLSSGQATEKPVDAYLTALVASAAELNHDRTLSTTLAALQGPELRKALLTELASLADSSGLVLDPDLDSYYLMLGLFQSFPRVIESLSTGSESLASSVKDLSYHWRRAAQADAGAYGEIAGFGPSATTLVGELDSTALTTTALLPLLSKAAEQGRRTLAAMLSARVSALTAALLVNLAIALAGLAIGGAILWLVAASVRRRAATLQSSLNTVANGSLGQPVPPAILQSSDELGSLARDLEAMRGSLKTRTDFLDSISRGDLSKSLGEVGSSDEVGQSLVRMQDSLRDLLEQITVTAEQVAVGTGALAEASRALADGTVEQAAAVKEVHTSLGLIEDKAKLNDKSAATGRDLAEHSLDRSRTGFEGMQSLLEAMESIEGSFREIKSVVKTIDDIAFQTNLLSVNANIEAARAGTAGKGFSVVAGEVRNLAKRSAISVVDTTRMVDDAARRVVEGREKAAAAMEQFHDIVGSAEKLAALIGETATGAKDQVRALKQVDSVLATIDQVTQNNAAGAEESSSSAGELSARAGHLGTLVGRFQLADKAEKSLSLPTDLT